MREIPRLDTHGLFHDDHGRISGRPTDLAGRDARPSAAAVFSVLQFGAIVPPLSPWEGVHRLLPGYRYDGVERLGPAIFEPSARLAIADAREQVDAFEALIDETLRGWIREHGEPVVLFSGGVDSGLIAARLKAMGLRPLLLNYSFGPEDPESRLAEAMAAHLGLPFERVGVPDRGLCDCLAEPGRTHPLPIGDSSTVPTSEFSVAVTRRLGEPRLLLDGTGADGGFGMAARIRLWQALFRVPRAIRSALGTAYPLADLWKSRLRVEFYARVFRMSSQMPLLPAVLCQNPLAGSFYDDGEAARVHDMLEAWIAGWAGEMPVRRIVAADLALTCANRFAQKGQPILEAGGHVVRYPFLDDAVAGAALGMLRPWRGGEPKALLKRALARHVPSAMVYRPKSGFADPKRRVFFEPRFLEYLRAAVDEGAPLSFILERKRVLRLCDLLKAGRLPPAYTRNFAWAVAFTDRWYRTAR